MREQNFFLNIPLSDKRWENQGKPLQLDPTIIQSNNKISHVLFPFYFGFFLVNSSKYLQYLTK